MAQLHHSHQDQRKNCAFADTGHDGTQMLASMETSTRPTRAEAQVSVVVNAHTMVVRVASAALAGAMIAISQQDNGEAQGSSSSSSSLVMQSICESVLASFVLGALGGRCSFWVPWTIFGGPLGALQGPTRPLHVP